MPSFAPTLAEVSRFSNPLLNIDVNQLSNEAQTICSSIKNLPVKMNSAKFSEFINAKPGGVPSIDAASLIDSKMVTQFGTCVSACENDPVRSWSSQKMSQLLEWRNPQGKEENWSWIYDEQKRDIWWKHLGKVIATELAQPLLATTAVIETVAYGLIAAPVAYFTNKEKFHHFVKIAQSSSFTVLWSIYNSVVNPFKINLLTRESANRCYINKFLPANKIMYRPEDRQEIQQYGLKSLILGK